MLKLVLVLVFISFDVPLDLLFVVNYILLVFKTFQFLLTFTILSIANPFRRPIFFPLQFFSFSRVSIHSTGSKDKPQFVIFPFAIIKYSI